MNKQKYKKIIDDLIKKSFPILRRKKIYISYFFIRRKYSGGAFWIFPFWRVIFINRKKEFTEKQLIGLLAHELCHFESFQKMGWLAYLFAGIRYWTSPQFRKKEEEATEKLTIEKGYSRECYSLAKRYNSKKLKASKYYLSPQEIKLYAQKIKKW